MVTLIECTYHTILTTITEEINQRLEDNYNWQFFDLWINDDTEISFGRIYREAFEIYNEMIHQQFTQEQLDIVENKGRNLQQVIVRWLNKWKENHPNLPNEKMPLSCLRYKIHEYIIYQLKQRDMRQIVGNPC